MITSRNAKVIDLNHRGTLMTRKRFASALPVITRLISLLPAPAQAQTASAITPDFKRHSIQP